MSTAILGWDGEEYELKYTFSIIRRLRAEGLNVTKIFRSINADAGAIADYADEIAEIIAWLLREAGCKGVTGEDIWRQSLSDPKLQKECYGLFMWVCTEHFSGPETAPKKKTSKRSTRTPKKRKT